MNDAYTPVPYDFKEVVESVLAAKTTGKIFYFCEPEFICDYDGKINDFVSVAGEGDFLIHNTGRIRLDKIITLYGKPGPAYDTYERYGNACMDCTAGFDPDDPRLD